jgi:hypothetical protein
MLATDPYVRVNGGPPRKLTKSPVEFEVTGGVVQVEVALFRSGHGALERRWSNPISRWTEDIGERSQLRLWFHPALFNSCWRRGHLRRANRLSVEKPSNAAASISSVRWMSKPS